MWGDEFLELSCFGNVVGWIVLVWREKLGLEGLGLCVSLSLGVRVCVE